MKTLLYVDDEEINRELFQLTFESKFNVVTAHSGNDALKIINTTPQINAIVSDMKMPGMNGIEFIKKAKNSLPDVPCFLLSGFDLNDEIKNALNEKVINHFFSKPMRINEIIDKIENSDI
ncbi:MAG: response regulator [Bacteroidales bacterium]|nr:response regulator [Bacteroidales bacterium]